MFPLKNGVAFFHCTVHQKKPKQKYTKRRCKLYSIPCFFSLSEKHFNDHRPFTLDRLADELSMCSHWT